MRSHLTSWTDLLTNLGFTLKKRHSLSAAKLSYGRRPQFEQCEDRRMLATYTVNVDYDVAAPFNLNDNIVTLREAIFQANQSANLDTIDFDSDLNSATITLGKDEQGNSIGTGELTITESVTIDGTIDGAGSSEELLGITIDAGNGTDEQFNTQDGFRAFSISRGSGQVEFNGLTLTGGDGSSGGGGAIYSGSDLTIKNTVITGNASYQGGGIYSFDSDLSLEDSMISGNVSVGTNGGGIYFYSYFLNQHLLSVVSSEITGNSTPLFGGGICVRGFLPSADIQSSNISGNQSGRSGGGIYFKGINLDLGSGSTIQGNNGGFHGGGLYASSTGGSVAIDNSTFDDNKVTSVIGQFGYDGEGGGAYIITSNSTVTITDGLVEQFVKTSRKSGWNGNPTPVYGD